MGHMEPHGSRGFKFSCTSKKRRHNIGKGNHYFRKDLSSWTATAQVICFGCIIWGEIWYLSGPCGSVLQSFEFCIICIIKFEIHVRIKKHYLPNVESERVPNKAYPYGTFVGLVYRPPLGLILVARFLVFAWHPKNREWSEVVQREVHLA